jgi:two-component system phosphate regulon sensor histidine kinase PhoR
VTELKRAENIRIEFVANVSHELRTPLTAIKGYTDTLREDVGHGRYDAAGKFLEVISRNVDRLMSLIGDLLDLSSLESHDGKELQKSTINTREITERVVAHLESRRAEKRHTIETRFTVEAVDADPKRLEQVLVNLIENAVKYVPASGKIVVSWESGEQNSVLLKVSDNGPGIPVEHHSRLFERFYRVDPGRSRDSGGTGLGLAIVKHIMQRHGGSVWISSEMGKGTTFICRFPRT